MINMLIFKEKSPQEAMPKPRADNRISAVDHGSQEFIRSSGQLMSRKL